MEVWSSLQLHGKIHGNFTWAISNPRPSPSRIFFAGTRTFSKEISACPWGASSNPNTVSGLFMLTPGVWTSTKIIDCCLCLGPVKSVFPWILFKIQITLSSQIRYNLFIPCHSTRTNHEYKNSASWIHGSASPPLGPIDDIWISLSVQGVHR